MHSETIQRVKQRGNSLVRELQSLQMEDTYLSRLGFGEDRHVLRSNRSHVDRDFKKAASASSELKDLRERNNFEEEESNQKSKQQQQQQQKQQQEKHKQIQEQQQQQQQQQNKLQLEQQHQQQQQQQQKQQQSQPKKLKKQQSNENKDSKPVKNGKNHNILEDDIDVTMDDDDDDDDINIDVDLEDDIGMIESDENLNSKKSTRKQSNKRKKQIQKSEEIKKEKKNKSNIKIDKVDVDMVVEDDDDEDDDVAKDSDFETTSLKRKILKSVYQEDEDNSEEKEKEVSERGRRSNREDKIEDKQEEASTDSGEGVGVSISVSTDGVSTTNGTSVTDPGDGGSVKSKRGRRKLNAPLPTTKTLEDFYLQQHIMVKNSADGFYYRARILKSIGEKIQLQFTGFTFSPFWLTKNSVRIWMGSNSKKDWSYQRRTGCWLPKKHAREQYREYFLGGKKATAVQDDSGEQEVQGPQVGRPRKKAKTEQQQQQEQSHQISPQQESKKSPVQQQGRDPPVRSIAVPMRNSAVPATRPIVQESGNDASIAAAVVTTGVNTHTASSPTNKTTTHSNSIQATARSPKKRPVTADTICAQPPKKRREFLYGNKQSVQQNIKPESKQEEEKQKEELNEDKNSDQSQSKGDEGMVDITNGSSRGSGGSEEMDPPLRQSRRTRKPTQKILESSKQQKQEVEGVGVETKSRVGRQKSWPQYSKGDNNKGGTAILSSASGSSKSLLNNQSNIDDGQFKLLRLMMSRQYQQSRKGGRKGSANSGHKTPDQQVIGSKILASFNSFKQEFNNNQVTTTSKHQGPSSNQSAQTDTQIKGTNNKPSPLPLFK